MRAAICAARGAAAEQLGQLRRGDGPAEEVLHARAYRQDQDRALGNVGAEAVGPKHGRHRRLRRDHRRLFRERLEWPDVRAHFHQGNLGTAAAGGLDRLPRVGRVLDHRSQVVQRRNGSFQLRAEPRIGTHKQDVDDVGHVK